MKITPKQFGDAIVKEAWRFVGLKEVRPNADWDNPKTGPREVQLAQELRTLMRPSPWQEGWAYCAAFGEAVVITAAKRLGLETKTLARMLQPGVLNTWRAFNGAVVKLTSDKPATGALWLLRHADKPGQGHMGIIDDWNPHNLHTVEANTSLDVSTPAKERDGDWITTRVSDWKGRGKLRTLGFITPEAMLTLCQ
jgi:hypothetical protein